MRVYANSDIAVADKAKEVAADSWGYSQGGILVVRDVSSFAVAVVLNEETGEGYLGHFSGQPLKHNETFKGYMAVLHEQQHGKKLSIWLGGIATLRIPSVHSETLEIYNDQAHQDVITLADAALNLREIAAEDIHTSWLGENTEIVVAQLDCASTTLEYSLREISPSEFTAA